MVQESKRAEHEQQATTRPARISGCRVCLYFDRSRFFIFLGKTEDSVGDIGLLGPKIVVGWDEVGGWLS